MYPKRYTAVHPDVMVQPNGSSPFGKGEATPPCRRGTHEEEIQKEGVLICPLGTTPTTLT